MQPDADTLTLDVAAQERDCMGMGPRKCLYVRENGKGDWQLFYDPIEGFTFEPGYTYTLRVKRQAVENPPADGSSLRYTLVKQLRKDRA
ncbi:hypothetical protein GCM10027578_39370 [Spirosoma luteolum]